MIDRFKRLIVWAGVKGIWNKWLKLQIHAELLELEIANFYNSGVTLC